MALTSSQHTTQIPPAMLPHLEMSNVQSLHLVSKYSPAVTSHLQLFRHQFLIDGKQQQLQRYNYPQLASRLKNVSSPTAKKLMRMARATAVMIKIAKGKSGW
jgi:hypothetical protein